MNSKSLKEMLAIVVLGAFVTGCSSLMRCEEKVNLEQLPPAVKTAVEKETVGGTLKLIEKEKCHDKVVYEVKYLKDNRKVMVKFTEDGKVVELGKNCEQCQKCGK